MNTALHPSLQFTLSTLFLVFFNVAASLALSRTWGLWNIAVILVAALCLNQAERLLFGIAFAFLLVFVGIICPGFILSCVDSREDFRRSACINNLQQLGIALHNYHDANKQFPSLYICDNDGKPLSSWRVDIIPMMEYGSLYDTLKKGEPWNSTHNSKVLNQNPVRDYQCPSDDRNAKDCSTNYVAVIGPGTVWRKDGPVKISDLLHSSSQTVMAVEVVNSGVHWAEPRDLTVEEALEGLKTGKGLRISTAHPSFINVLFANGEVRLLPARMPISLWQKLLAGEVKDVANISAFIDPAAPDMVNVSINPSDTPSKETILLGVIVWLISVGLLFHRAIKSRGKAVAEVITSNE
jgi:hypothetical protein